MTLPEYQELLRKHDWTFDFSDDPRAFARGSKERSTLRNLAVQYGDEFKRAYNAAEKRVFDQPHFGPYVPLFPVSAQAETEPQNTQQPDKSKHMKPDLNKLWDIPLGTFLATIFASVLGAPAAKGETQAPKPAPADEDPDEEVPAKPAAAAAKTRGRPAAKPAEAEKPAPKAAPAAAADDDDDADEVTLDMLRKEMEPMKSIPSKSQKLQDFMQKKLGHVGPLSKLPAEHYARMLAKMKKVAAEPLEDGDED